MDRNTIKAYFAASASHHANGNSWCHVDSCGGSYASYRINIWGLKSPEENWQKKNRNMIAQQVTNIDIWPRLMVRLVVHVYGVCVCACILSMNPCCHDKGFLKYCIRL